MGHFNKFDKGRGNRGFGSASSAGRGGDFHGGHGFRGRNDGPKQMFPATCTKCGQDCEVPFRPTGDRPVFCSNCFKSQGGPSQRFAPKSFGPVSSAGRGGGFGGGVSKEQFDSLNVKLDKILSLLTAVPADALKAKEKKTTVKKTKTSAKKAKKKQ